MGIWTHNGHSIFPYDMTLDHRASLIGNLELVPFHKWTGRMVGCPMTQNFPRNIAAIQFLSPFGGRGIKLRMQILQVQNYLRWKLLEGDSHEVDIAPIQIESSES